MTTDASVVGGGRFDSTIEGYAAMLEYVAAWPHRVWATWVLADLVFNG